MSYSKEKNGQNVFSYKHFHSFFDVFKIGFYHSPFSAGLPHQHIHRQVFPEGIPMHFQ